jgi:hypothetical protein
LLQGFDRPKKESWESTKEADEKCLQFSRQRTGKMEAWQEEFISLFPVFDVSG